jgi:hypothetical protein
MNPKAHQWIIFGLLWFICMLVYALNLWSPTRAVIAPQQWPDYTCAISGLLALISISYHYLNGTGGTLAFYLYLVVASMIFGFAGWIIEDLLYVGCDDLCMRWGHIPIALIGTIFYGLFAVPIHYISKTVKKHRTIVSSQRASRAADA